jgi:hypothetical protein
MKIFVERAAMGAAVLVLLLAAGRSVNGGEHALTSLSAEEVTQGQYCTQGGGVVEQRYPVYGTNGGVGLALSGRAFFCQYTATDGSRIHVLMSTLYSPHPTLAALAYYAQVTAIGGQGNPASVYCSQLGGSDLFGGINAAGGGWVQQHTTDTVLEACIFPDLSSIDSFGLFYHSAGIIRGIDLGTVLRYPKPAQGAQRDPF